MNQIVDNPLEISRLECLKLNDYNEAKVAADIKYIREWLKTQPHIPEVSDTNLELMLFRAKFSLENLKRKIDSHFTFKLKHIEFLKTIDPLDSEVQNIYDVQSTILVPKQTPNKERIIIAKIESSIKFDVALNNKLLIIIDTYRLNIDYSYGIKFIWDMANYNSNILSVLTPSAIRELYQLHTEGFGNRVCGVHILNAPPFINILFSIFKAILKPKMYNRIQVHQNLESLHAIIPKDILPIEYGGSEMTCREMEEQQRDMFIRNRELIINEIMKTTDEKKRPRMVQYEGEKEITYGSFRKLDID